MITVLAIDPGSEAALALVQINSNGEPHLVHSPVMVRVWDKIKNGPSAMKIIPVINTWASLGPVDQIVIEKVRAMPDDGRSSLAKFMLSTGVLKGALEAHFGVSVMELSPGVWKPMLGLSSDKKQSIKMARKLFGKEYFPLMKDHDKAEASLMAAFIGGWRP